MRLEEQSKMKDNKQWRIPYSLGRWYRVTAGHAVVLNVIFLSCFLFAAVYRLHVKVEPEVKILYGEAHTGNGGGNSFIHTGIENFRETIFRERRVQVKN